MKIAFVFNSGRIQRIDSVTSGVAPSEFFYGAIEMGKNGHTIDYYEIDPKWAPGWFGGIINSLAYRGLLPEKMTGGVVVQINDLINELREYDVVVATTSGIGFALAIQKFIRKLSWPLVCIQCGIFNNPYNYFKRKTSEILLSRMDSILFGEGELPPYRDLFKRCKLASVNQFGVDRNFWFPSKEEREGDYILSIGNDGRRDFDTVIEAARSLDMELKILTSRPLPENLPGNVTLLKSSWHNEVISDMDLRELYQNSHCTVVSIVDSYQPSGQSVALQAMACGSPVILTRTKGLWSDSLMKDKQNVLFCRPGNHEDIVRCVQDISADAKLRETLIEGARETIESTCNIECFADGVEAICSIAEEN